MGMRTGDEKARYVRMAVWDDEKTGAVRTHVFLHNHSQRYVNQLATDWVNAKLTPRERRSCRFA